MATRAKNRGENRPKRVPVSGRRDVMTVIGKEDGYVYRWVNDTEDRIQTFRAGGYECVSEDVEVGDNSVDSSKGTESLVTKGVGGGVTAYLMRIKQEFYDEDRAAASARVDAEEEDMKRTLNDGKDGKYGGVTFS